MTNQLTPEEIKDWRDETGLTQHEFAALLGISRTTVARLEGGELEAMVWLFYARAGWRAENGRGGLASRIENIIREIVREEIRKP